MRAQLFTLFCVVSLFSACATSSPKTSTQAQPSQESEERKKMIAGRYGPAKKLELSNSKQLKPSRTPASHPPGYKPPKPQLLKTWSADEHTSMAIMGFDASEGGKPQISECVLKTKTQTFRMTRCTLPYGVNPFSPDGKHLALPIYTYAARLLVAKTSNVDGLIKRFKHHNVYSVQTLQSMTMKSLLNDPKTAEVSNVVMFNPGSQDGGTFIGWKSPHVLSMDVTHGFKVLTMEYNLHKASLTTTKTRVDQEMKRDAELFEELKNQPSQ